MNNETEQKDTAPQQTKIENNRMSIETPKREALLLSPSALIQIGASPVSKRYNSIRKIDFETNEKKKVHASAKKLDFFK